MDLNKVESSADVGEWMDVVNPRTGVPIPHEDGVAMGINLKGGDSEDYQKRLKRQQTDTIRTAGKIGRIAKTGDQLDEENLDLLVDAVVDWRGFEEDGEAIPCTPANVRRVFKEHKWIRDQAWEFVNDRSNFLGNL